MTYLLFSVVLLAFTLLVLRPATENGPPPQLLQLDGRDVLLAFIATLALALGIGVPLAMALAAAIGVKYAGHLLGRQIVGPRTGPARAGDLGRIFVALSGPIFGLAPMLAALALADVAAGPAPEFARAAWGYALAASLLNAIVLLPLRPLAGGRMIRLVAPARFHRHSQRLAGVATAFAIGAALTLPSPALLVVGLLTGVALLQPLPDETPACPLSPAEARLGLAAHAATLAVYVQAAGRLIFPLGLGA